MHQTYATAPAREKETVDDAALVKATKRDRSAFAALYREGKTSFGRLRVGHELVTKKRNLVTLEG